MPLGESERRIVVITTVLKTNEWRHLKRKHYSGGAAGATAASRALEASCAETTGQRRRRRVPPPHSPPQTGARGRERSGRSATAAEHGEDRERRGDDEELDDGDGRSPNLRAAKVAKAPPP